MPLITVVVSTYNEPNALLNSLQGMFWQTSRNWRILVVGDACDDDTRSALSELREPRLTYVNLPQRFGEQSGPNSIGMALADTDLIAFLNQDDLWLPDHLEHAIDCLERENADFFTGRSVFAAKHPTDRAKARFIEAPPPARHLHEAFWSPFYLFEPVSSWVMTKTAADRVGPWRQAATLFRTPLEDWILRAYRREIKHIASSTITAIKNNLAAEKTTAGARTKDAEILRHWYTDLCNSSLPEFRNQISQDLEAANLEGRGRDFRTITGPGNFSQNAEMFLTPGALAFFKETGWDAMETACTMSGLEKGWLLRQKFRNRNMGNFPVPPDFEETLEAVKLKLA